MSDLAQNDKWTLLLAGDLQITKRLYAQIKDSQIIAVDSGIKHAPALNILPRLWLGDFDSANIKQILASYPQYGAIERKIYNADKDKSDGALALDYAMARGARQLFLLGAFGGRFDHVFFHISQALALAHKERQFILTSGLSEGQILRPDNILQYFDYAPGTVFSILPLSDIKGLTIKGAKWNLEQYDIEFGSTLSLSNRVVGDLAISLQQGRAMLYVSF